LRPALRRRLDGLVDVVMTAVGTDVAEYRRPFEGSFGAGVRVGVEVALSRFCDLPGTAASPLAPDEREVYVALGRGELRQGRSLEALLAAYRVGARVAFRHFAADATEAGLAPVELVTLAEAIFAYIDELSAASVEGFAAEQLARAGEQERRRSDLLALLLTGRGDAAAVEELARSVGWRLPPQAAVVLVPESATEGAALRLGAAALVGDDGASTVAVIPAASSATARQRLTAALHDRAAVIGPGRAWPQLPASVRLARLAARLREDGRLPAADPLWADEHLPSLLLAADEEIAAELVRRRLAPLDAVRPPARKRLAETLLAWLSYRGERQRIAAALHVHPQTVGYRLGQLRALYGTTLDDPDARFELELALRAAR
jgi:hypothetical protein